MFFENAPIGVAIGQGGAKVLFANEVFRRLMGRSDSDFSKMDWQSVVHPDDIPRIAEGIRAFFASETDGYRDTLRILRGDGTSVWGHLIVALIDHEAPRREAQYLLLLEDITESYEAQLALEFSMNRYKELFGKYEQQFYFMRSLFDAMDDWIIYKDKRGVYQGCNKSFERFIGLPEERIVGHVAGEIIPKETLELALAKDQEALLVGCSVRYEHAVDVGGEKMIMDVLKTPYRDGKGNILGIVCIARDVTERRRREDEILYMSEHDALTGLHNRAYFQKTITTIDVPENLPVSVIMCDLNGLNLINDSFGHADGDELIRRVADILRGCAREGDLVARVGGDEFYFILPHTTEEACKAVYESIETAYNECAAEAESVLRYSSIAMGGATKQSMEEPLTETIRVAEEFMYRRKMLAQKGIHGAILNSIRSTLHEKSYETQDHADRIAFMARRMGALLGMNPEDQDLLELAASLHDIGKITIDQSILLKPTPLSSEEWRKLQQHPEIGYRITQAIPELRSISEIVLSHHERWDGSGYPQGLKRCAIPEMARIITIVDAFDAMTEGRPYKDAMTKEAAKEELLRLSGRQFDPEMVRLFLEKVYPYGTGPQKGKEESSRTERG